MKFERFLRGEQHQYITSMRPVLSKRALFSDTTGNFISPAEPAPYSEVTIRFRSKKNNLDRVFLVCQGERNLMFKVSSDSLFDYYEVKYQLDNEKITYYFEIQAGRAKCYYDTRGVVKQTEAHYYFCIIPGFSTPDWAKGAVMYQIMVDRFCNGDPSNDVLTGEYQYIGDKSVRVEDWYRYPAQMDVRNFYGGDLQGVLDKMDYLQDLGIDVIYFNPLFVSPSNHGYDIQDYDNVDPHKGRIVSDEGDLLADWQTENRFATRYIDRVTNPKNLEASNQLFIELVEEAHRRGMRVIIDGVFNHCGSFNKWLDGEEIYARAGGYEPGAFLSAKSPYRSFFHFHDQRDEAWPRNKSYDGWWGHETLPKLNYEESDKLVEYILNIARRWISPPFCVDGWRLDVAADLGNSGEYNHQFWRKFRQAVKEVNPDVLILAEHYGDPSSWLQGDQWDSVMNYDAFMEPVTWFLTGMEKHSDSHNSGICGDGKSFFDAMAYHMSRMQTGSLLTAMNELSNHDHSRFLTRTNRKVGRIATAGAEMAGQDVKMSVMREAVMIQMTWPGAPTIYYGDEAGVCGWTDPDSRRTYPWGREDLELLEYHRYMIGLHKRFSVLRKGSIKPLLAEKDVIAYGRMYKKYHALTVINNGEQEKLLEIPVWQLGITDEIPVARLMLTTEAGYNVGKLRYPVKDGILRVELPPFSGALFASFAEELFAVTALPAADGEDEGCENTSTR